MSSCVKALDRCVLAATFMNCPHDFLRRHNHSLHRFGIQFHPEKNHAHARARNAHTHTHTHTHSLLCDLFVLSTLLFMHFIELNLLAVLCELKLGAILFGVVF